MAPTDAIIRVTGCAIFGSDLHIYDGAIPSMERGDVLGQETMGEVVETGVSVSRVKKGDRAVCIIVQPMFLLKNQCHCVI